MKGKAGHSALWLVIFGVCMVSYSGPMIKGALNAGATPVSVALVRMLAAGAVMLPLEIVVCRKRGERFSVGNAGLWGWTALSAVFLAGHYLTWITSLTGTSTFASVALVCTQPLFVSLFGYLLFREVMPRRAVPGALLSLAGAVLIAVSGLLGDAPPEAASPAENLTSSLLALMGAVLMAAHWLTGRHIRRTVSAEVYTPVLYLCTAALLVCCLPWMGGFRMPVEALPYMAGLVLGSTLLGHALLTFALSRVSAGVISFALLGEPVGAMIFGILFLGEQPTPWVLVGGGLILLGLCLYLAFSQNKAQTVAVVAES